MKEKSMANTVTISSAEELSRYKTTILSNLRKSVQDIKAMIDSEDAQELMKLSIIMMLMHSLSGT